MPERRLFLLSMPHIEVCVVFGHGAGHAVRDGLLVDGQTSQWGRGLLLLTTT